MCKEEELLICIDIKPRIYCWCNWNHNNVIITSPYLIQKKYMHLVATLFPGILLTLPCPSGSWVVSLWCWWSYSGSAVFGVLHQDEYDVHVIASFFLALGSTSVNFCKFTNKFLHKLMGCFGMRIQLQESFESLRALTEFICWETLGLFLVSRTDGMIGR